MSPSEITSPPLTDRPPTPPPPDPRQQLNQLAAVLVDARDAQVLREYLQLRARLRL